MNHGASPHDTEAEHSAALRKAVFTELIMPQLGEVARLLGGKGGRARIVSGNRPAGCPVPL